MIHSMSLDLETFAAKRRGLMEEYDKGLEPHVADALKRVGLASWEYHLVQYLEKLFTDLVKAESEEWVPAMEDLRDEFVREVAETLRKTTPVPPERFNEQVQRVTRWLSTMTINAATEAAVAGDSEDVGLEWVTMQDDRVRETHKEMHGSLVPTGGEFELADGTKVMYPGQPKGDPANWINCRCAARPAFLGSSLVAAAQKEEQVAQEEAPEETDDGAQPIPDEQAMLQVPWHGVLAPEGVPSGDGRMFAPDALTWRDLPLPIKSMFVDDEGHKGSVITARIDRIFREDGLVKAEGVFDTTPEAYESVRMLAEGMWRGVSVDIDQAELSVSEFDEQKGTMNVTFGKGRICAATLCAIPAFAEAWVKLGTWADDPDYKAKQETPAHAGVKEAPVSDEVKASLLEQYGNVPELTEEFRPVPPQTKDGPGWITHPDVTEDITNYWVDGRGAAKIRWGQGGDFNRCRTQLAKYVQNPDWLAGLCANLHYRALGIWPGEHKAGGQTATFTPVVEESPMPSVVLASAGTTIRPSVDYFTNPRFEAVTPMTVDEETGEVFGHIAAWDTCHVANPQGPSICTTPPHSATDYAYFLTGEIETDAGPVPVGRLSFGGGHADGRLGLVAAMAHYDNVANAFADVYCGEDEHGIWVHGLMREGLTAKDVREFRASPPSGDWRNVVVRGEEQLEMIAVCSVNVPGFPVPRVSMQGERQKTLIAAGVVPVPENEGDRRAERIEAFRAKAREMKLARIQNEIRKLKEK